MQVIYVPFVQDGATLVAVEDAFHQKVVALNDRMFDRKLHISRERLLECVELLHNAAEDLRQATVHINQARNWPAARRECSLQ